MRGLFVTGTDTGVGKTAVASAIARTLAAEGRRVGVFKPVATGLDPAAPSNADDPASLAAAIGEAVPLERVTPLRYREPVAPPVAARLERARLSKAAVWSAVGEALAWWRDEFRAEILVVEGVGGWLCPLAEGATVADLAADLDFPAVVVARRGLGTLNHTLMTVEAARRRGLRVAGVVLNQAEPAPGDDPASRTNAGALAERLPGIAILADVHYLPRRASLPDWLRGVDWYDRAEPPRGFGVAMSHFGCSPSSENANP